jgi:hypothetical protein
MGYESKESVTLRWFWNSRYASCFYQMRILSVYLKIKQNQNVVMLGWGEVMYVCVRIFVSIGTGDVKGMGGTADNETQLQANI